MKLKEIHCEECGNHWFERELATAPLNRLKDRPVFKRFVEWWAHRRRRKLFLLACAVLTEARHREVEMVSEDRDGNKATIKVALIDVYLS